MAGQFGNIGKYQLKDIGWAPDRGLATQCAVCAQQAVSGMQHSAQRDTHPHLIPAIINAGKLPHNPGDHSRLTAQLECKCLSAPKGHLSACTIIPVSKSSESVIPGCKQWTHAADYHAHDKYPIPMQAWEDTTKSAYIQFLNSQMTSIITTNSSIIPCLKSSYSAVPEAVQMNSYSWPEASSITCQWGEQKVIRTQGLQLQDLQPQVGDDKQIKWPSKSRYHLKVSYHATILDVQCAFIRAE